ncbi:MAG: type II toxin-antitoxin system VapC family toxin [Acidobacteriota bacterium]|nr:type II toxin-antitoxin system VapC family toxin [Acidobacteriota bacterium]
MIVVDTNVLAYAAIPGQATANALAAYRRDPEWLAPVLWRSELRNVLSLEMRHRGMALSDALLAFGEAEQLVSEPDAPVDTVKVLLLAGSSGASAYDCEFAALAQGLGVRLVTADRRLAERFPAFAIELGRFVAL